MLLKAVLRSRPELIDTPARSGDADDRHVEASTLHHRLQCREDFLVGEIARCAKENQRVRVGIIHGYLLQKPLTSRRVSPGVHRTGNASQTKLYSRSEEHTSELQSRETISYAVFC